MYFPGCAVTETGMLNVFVCVLLYEEVHVLLISVEILTPPSETNGTDTLPETSVDTLKPVVVEVVVYVVDDVEKVGVQVIGVVYSLLSQFAVSTTMTSASI